MSDEAKKTKPPTIELVKEAIRDLNEPRKGVSVAAMKQWVVSHYPETDQTRLGPLLKKALQKALDEGMVERPAKSTATGILTGRYKLGKTLKDAEKKAAAKEVSDAKKAAKAETGGGGRSRAPSKKAVDKKLHRRSLSVGASTPKAKKSKSKIHAVTSRRAKSHSPAKSPMKSPKAARKAPAKKKVKTPTKKAKKSPAKAKDTKKAAKKAKSPAAKAKKPAAKSKAKKGSTSKD